MTVSPSPLRPTSTLSGARARQIVSGSKSAGLAAGGIPRHVPRAHSGGESSGR